MAGWEIPELNGGLYLGKSSIQMGFGCSQKKWGDKLTKHRFLFMSSKGVWAHFVVAGLQCNVYHHKGFRVSISWAAPKSMPITFQISGSTPWYPSVHSKILWIYGCSIMFNQFNPQNMENPRVLDGFRPIPIQILQSPHPNPTLATSAFQTHVCSLCGAVFADASAPRGHEKPGDG